jgi:hypothetical protein
VASLPGYGQVETLATAGQFIVRATATFTMEYSIQLCENCLAEKGTIAPGGTYTTTGTAGTYDQIKIVLQYWNGSGTSIFVGTRAGSICSGIELK